MKIRIRENQLEEIEGLSTEYPYTCHHVNLTDTRVPWHWHEELEFVYVVSGAVTLTTTNQNLVFQKGEGFFINTNILCTMGRPPLSIPTCFIPYFSAGILKVFFLPNIWTPFSKTGIWSFWIFAGPMHGR